MKTYKVTLMVPKTLRIAANSIQDAHSQVYKMIHQGTPVDNTPRPIMHSILVEDEDKIEVVA